LANIIASKGGTPTLVQLTLEKGIAFAGLNAVYAIGLLDEGALPGEGHGHEEHIQRRIDEAFPKVTTTIFATIWVISKSRQTPMRSMNFVLLMPPQLTWRCSVLSGGFEDHDSFMEAKSQTKPPEVIGFRRFVWWS